MRLRRRARPGGTLASRAGQAPPARAGDARAGDARAGVDGVVERAGRWLAGRTTRRGFLGAAGRVGVLVAAGPTLAALLADRAEARVCGQTGVAPACDTFTCDATWGWCWYATGCCANGATKKICDCCAPNTPHPVGYCPSGTRVRCIVESCGNDPRLMTKPVVRLGTADGVALAITASRRRHARATTVVIGDVENARHAAVAAGLTSPADGPLLLTSRDTVPAPVLEEIGRLGAEHALVAGPGLGEGVDDALVAAGVHPYRVGSHTSEGPWSAEVARWHRERTGERAALVLAGGIGVRAAGPVAAVAALRGWPVLLGVGSAVRRALAEPRPVERTVVVTDDADEAGGLPGVDLLASADPAELSVRLGNRVLDADWETTSIGVACYRDPAAAIALAGLGGPVLLHHPGTLGGARVWVLRNRDRIGGALASGSRWTFPAEAEHDLQALLNVFETHELVGGSGDGLPIMSQPRSERPIGEARW